MAYGKIKADTFVYDNSGSDVEVTLSSLGSKANLPASAGTVGASEVVQVDANKDITGFRNVTLSGDLTVNGTTTTINSTTLAVDDKNIVLGDVTTPSDTTADGGGITLKGASDKTFNWIDSTDAWTSSEHIVTADGKRILIGTTTEGDPGADNLTIADSGACGITIRSGTSDNGQIFFSDGTSGDAEYRGMVLYSHANEQMQFKTNATLALTINSSQNATFAGTVSDSKGDVRKIPINFHNAATYTLVASDAGKVISEATNSANITVPASVFSGGDAVTIMNHNGGNTTITQGSGVTMYNAADGSTGNRTLAARGFCTLFFREHNTVYISGAGLS